MTDMPSVHQLLPSMSINDAIGNETILIQRILKQMGHDSEIYAENIHPSLKTQVKHYSKYEISKDDIFIYHHSIGCGLMDFISSLESKIIMIYHNITPPYFYEGINKVIADLARLGLKQLEILKDRIDVAVGDSEFNRLELEKIGYKRTGVLPILLDLTKYGKPIDKNLVLQYDKTVNILYVGRIAPNKGVDEVIRIFSYYYFNVNPDSNLFLVGGYEGNSDKYYSSLQKMIDSTGMKNIHFINDADDNKLNTLYSMATIFITMSKHEGFCVPLVESMYFKVPIIAPNRTAIPYTLEDSGILVNDETYEEIGELIDVVVNDAELRKKVIEKQNTRFNSIYCKDNVTMVSDLLKTLKS